MKFIEFFKGIGTTLSKVLGDDPRYRVEESDEGVLVTELVKSGIDKANAAKVIESYRNMTRNEKKYSNLENAAINLDSNDIGYKLQENTPEVEKSNSFRDDSTMQMVRNTEIKNISAKELPNSKREAGGRSRDSRIK